MPTINAGTSPTISLDAGQRLAFAAGGAGLATVFAVSTPEATYPLGAAPVTIGPFAGARTVSINAERALSYQQLADNPQLFPPVQGVVQDPSTGQQFAGGAPVSGGGIVGVSKIRKLLSAIGQAAYRRVNLSYHGHSIVVGVDANSSGAFNAASLAAWNTQSQAAVLAKVLSAASGGAASSSMIAMGGIIGSLNPLLTLGGGAPAQAVDGLFGPYGTRVTLTNPAHTLSFAAVGTAVRVYCVASGAGSTTPLRWSAPSVSGGVTQTGPSPAASPNPGNTPDGTRTWCEFTIGPVVPGETVSLVGPTSGSYSVYLIDADYKTTPGVTVNRIAQSGATLAGLHAAATDNTDTGGYFGGWLGSGNANVRLGQQQSLSVRVPSDGALLQTEVNDLNEWAQSWNYTLADLQRHLSNYLSYHNTLGLPVLMVLGPIRDPSFSVGTRPYQQTDLIAAYKAVIDAAPNAAYLDLTAEFGGATTAGYALQGAAGLMQDNVHPNQIGHGYFGNRIAQALLAAAARAA